MCSSIKRRTRSSTLNFSGSIGLPDGAALALELLALMPARMAGRSFQPSSCLASSLLSFLRALKASLSLGEPSMACSFRISSQTLGGGKVIGHPLFRPQPTHRHTRKKSNS